MHRIRILFAALLTVGLVFSACSTDDDDSAATESSSDFGDSGGDDSGVDTAAAGATASAAQSSDDAASSGGGGTAGGDVTVTDVGPVDLVAAAVDRKIVYTGRIDSTVDDAAVAANRAKDAAAAEGGYVFGQESTGGASTVVVKVPSVRFDAAFDAIADIGEVTSQRIEADDVTERFTDLASRQDTLEASIVRLRGFLAQTNNVDEISRLESELTRREAERDVIAGQLRVLRDRTAFGTITATFTVDDVAESAVQEEESGPPGFGRGLAVGWDGALVIAASLATAAGFVLPFLPVLAAVAAAGWWLRRRDQSGVSALADRPS